MLFVEKSEQKIPNGYALKKCLEGEYICFKLKDPCLPKNENRKYEPIKNLSKNLSLDDSILVIHEGGFVFVETKNGNPSAYIKNDFFTEIYIPIKKAVHRHLFPHQLRPDFCYFGSFNEDMLDKVAAHLHDRYVNEFNDQFKVRVTWRVRMIRDLTRQTEIYENLGFSGKYMPRFLVEYPPKIKKLVLRLAFNLKNYINSRLERSSGQTQETRNQSQLIQEQSQGPPWGWLFPKSISTLKEIMETRMNLARTHSRSINAMGIQVFLDSFLSKCRRYFSYDPAEDGNNFLKGLEIKENWYEDMADLYGSFGQTQLLISLGFLGAGLSVAIAVWASVLELDMLNYFVMGVSKALTKCIEQAPAINSLTKICLVAGLIVLAYMTSMGLVYLIGVSIARNYQRITQGVYKVME